MKQFLGDTGKNYSYGNNSITVSRPDGSKSTVNKGDKLYNATHNAMMNDGYNKQFNNGANKTSTTSALSNYQPTYGGVGTQKNPFYKVNQNGSKTYMNEQNKKYFPNNYGGSVGHDYKNPVLNEEMVNGKPVGAIGTNPYSNNRFNMIGGGNGNYEKSGDKYIDGSFRQNINYGQDAQYHDQTFGGRYKIAEDGSRVYMTHANKKYFPEIIDGIETGGGAKGKWNTAYGVGYNDDTKHRIATKEDDIIGYYYSDMSRATNEERAEFESWLKTASDDDLNKFFAENQGEFTQNFKNLLEQNVNPEFETMGALSMANEAVMGEISKIIYNIAREQGVVLDGMTGLELAQLANKNGVGAPINPNSVNEHNINQQLVDNTNAYNKENGINETLSFDINEQQIIDGLLQAGFKPEDFLTNGYQIGEDGKVGISDGFIQVGNTLMNPGVAIRNAGNLEGFGRNIQQNEKWLQQETGDANLRHEAPLEFRAKYMPETMTPDMEVALQQERELKSQMDSMSIELEIIDEILSGGFGSGSPLSVVSAGGGAGGGTKSQQALQADAISRAVGGGNTESVGVTGKGKEAQKGKAFFNTETIKQRLGR